MNWTNVPTEEGIVAKGVDIGIKDQHRYISIKCSECGSLRWVRVGIKSSKCFSCSRPKSFLGELTEERRSNMSKAQVKRFKRDGVPDYFSRNKNGSNNPMFGKHQTDESKAKNSNSNKTNWSNPEYQKKWAESHLSPWIGKTKPEQELELILSKYCFEYTGNGTFWIGYPPRNPDFINKEKKLIVEFFGNYWHKEADEQSRINHYSKYGWKCLIIWESDYTTNKDRELRRFEEII